MPTGEVTAKAATLIRRPRDDVFNAFVDPAIMSQFWFKRQDQGLHEGDTVTWFIGDGPDAPEIEVRVKSIKPPSQIVIEWGVGDQFTTVSWTLEDQGAGATRLMIEESGFTGSREDVIARALDSTGGFNQVIVALKALLEHNAVINVVADHA